MEFKTPIKTFVKSKNSVKNIYLNYTYSLIGFIILLTILYLISGNNNLIFPLYKSIFISLVISSIIQYIINIINKKYNFLAIYTKDNTHIIAIIIGLFGLNSSIIILSIAIFISLLIKKIYKGINLSSTLYGILIIILYKYYNNSLITPLTNFNELANYGTFSQVIGNKKDVINYLIGINYLSPILSMISFIYLFHKKSIKYNIYISYLLTFSFIMLIHGILNDMSLWFIFFELTSGNILFLSVYALTDYQITPTLAESQILYGIILGIISSILRFIIPELSVIIPLILGPILLTKLLDNLSPKLKYHKKTYDLLFITSIILITITIIILSIIY